MPVTQTTPSLLNKPSKTRTSEKIWLPVWRDTAGDLIATGAGYLPVKPLYEQYSVGVYIIKIFKPYSDAEFAAELDTLNSAGWGGFSENQAWISEIHTSEETQVGDDTGEFVTYVIRCIKREDGWKFQHPNVGYVYKDGSDLKSFLTVDDCPFIGNLDSSGADNGGTMEILLSDTKETLLFSSIGGLS